MADGMKKPFKFSKELQNAMYDDYKRQAVDNAKKRAVAQRVDYDTFKNMVLTAHLKPLQAANTLDKGSALPAWAFAADGAAGVRQQEQPAAGSSSLLAAGDPGQLPRSSADFQREWRRSCTTPELRFQYLQRCGPELLASLFKVDVSSDLLAQLLLALAAGAQLLAQQEQAQQQCDAGFILRALQALTTAGRFGLNVRLLGGKVQAAVRQMFSDISSCLPSSREAAAMPEGGAAGDEAAAAAEGPGALELAAKLQRLYGAA